MSAPRQPTTTDGAAAGRPLRVMLTAIGEAGHAFPMIALGRELRARGHEPALHTWVHWREHIEREGIRFVQAPRFDTAPGEEIPNAYQAAGRAAERLAEDVRDFAPDVVVADVLTLGGALAAELNDLPWITLVPHFWHVSDEDQPPFGSGWAPARNPLAKRFFRRISKLEAQGLALGRTELNETRAVVGLPPVDRVHGGVSSELVLVGTVPQLEPERPWPEHVKLVGPLVWEPPSTPTELPPGDEPLVVAAPSTAQDLDHTMLGACVSGLRDRPVRLLASKNAREPQRPLKPGHNTLVVDWVSYSQTFPQAAVVVCHGGHGTVMRALTEGAPVVVCPASGDQFETAARLRWAGVGVSVPQRFISSRTIAAAVEKVIARPEMRERAGEIASWAAARNATARAVDEIERYVWGRAG